MAQYMGKEFGGLAEALLLSGKKKDSTVSVKFLAVFLPILWHCLSRALYNGIELMPEL